MLLREVRDAFAFEIHHADDTIADDERNSHFGADIGMRRNVSRIRQDVVDANDLALLRGSAGDSLPERDIVEVDALVVPLAEAMAKAPVLRIDKQDAEGIVVDERADRFGDLRQQLVELKDRREFLARVAPGCVTCGSASARGDGAARCRWTPKRGPRSAAEAMYRFR